MCVYLFVITDSPHLPAPVCNLVTVIPGPLSVSPSSPSLHPPIGPSRQIDLATTMYIALCSLK